MRNLIVLPERPRAPRYVFSANIELIDVESEAILKERTCDLSLFGCFAKASTPWAVGTKVRVKITYKGSAFTALGHVAQTRGNGMGVQFSEMAPKDAMVLEIWMAELREDASQKRP
jgi:PilZ domain